MNVCTLGEGTVDSRIKRLHQLKVMHPVVNLEITSLRSPRLNNSNLGAYEAQHTRDSLRIVWRSSAIPFHPNITGSACHYLFYEIHN